MCVLIEAKLNGLPSRYNPGCLVNPIRFNVNNGDTSEMSLSLRNR